tara:strand:+ start:752 stop:1342 length:591 start_codon:yes stop_codon:yes gene_type:complete
MNKNIEFYYDFISPYSYLAHKKILKIEKTKKINFVYKPILLGGLHNLLKITAPAFIKSKKQYLVKDCEMIAKKLKIEFTFNTKFPINSINLMRGVLVIEENKKKKFINEFFEAYWSLNIDLSNDNQLKKLLNNLNIDSNEYFIKINNQKTKDLLRSITQQAYDKEIFGAPTFIVNNKIFWGQDRLDYAIDEFERIK